MPRGFLDRERLLYGPWQAFERDIARLLIQNGFVDVRLIGGPGDHGADILGVKDGALWVLQCKHTTSSPPPSSAVDEVVEAARYYSADRAVIAVSRPPTEAFIENTRRHERQGLRVEIATPAVLLDLVDKSPEYSPSRRELRDYQVQATALLREALLDTGRGQLVLATGLGKTIIVAEMVSDLMKDGLVRHDRALVVAHTHELVDQLHRSFWYQLPKRVATQHFVGGEKPHSWTGLVFATIQSVAAEIDTLPSFGLVVVDEAHHIGAQVFRDVVDRLKPRMLCGVTATPWRGDGYDLNLLLGRPLMQIGIAEGLQRGFLCDVDYRLCADDLDWAFVQARSQYRYSIAQLNRQLIIPIRDEEAARTIRQIFDQERRTGGIVFCPTIVHARAMAATLRRYAFKAESLSADTPPRERALVMARFRAGQLDVVTTVDLFNEGVDVPDVDLVVFMRATHSRRIFVQQLGRGLRLSPGKKHVVVLDFVTDLRRVAEVVELDRAVKAGPIERLGLGNHLMSFTDESAGSFLREWVLDQASVILREGDPELELPELNFPQPVPPGRVQ